MQVAHSKGGLLASLRQALEQDPKREVVRGYFDVGAPPDTHRYYCLVNPKTGKFLENGVAGTTYVRPDGMTGIKNPVVSDLNCASAEQSRILVTTGFTLNGSFGGTNAPAAGCDARSGACRGGCRARGRRSDGRPAGGCRSAAAAPRPRWFHRRRP